MHPKSVFLRVRTSTSFRARIDPVFHQAFRWPWARWVGDRLAGTSTVRLVSHVVALNGLTKPMRVGFASDLHFGPTTSRKALRQSAELLHQQRADLLVLGGDFAFLEARPRYLAELDDWLRSFAVPNRVAVLGNHDRYTDHEALIDVLSGAGVRVLVNQAVAVRGFEGVMVGGLDCTFTGAPDAAAVASEARDATALIGVSHSPDGHAQLADIGAQLVLSGHAHGGQVRAPGMRFWTPLFEPREQPWGLHRERDSWLFISRGVGTSEIPFRFRSPPDVAMLDLVPEGAPHG